MEDLSECDDTAYGGRREREGGSRERKIMVF
jgi:hypothetical protein